MLMLILFVYLPREAVSLIEQAEKRQKDAQNADKKAADMLLLNTSAEKVFWTRGCQSWKKWRGSPCRS
ncbi:hypothetical protein O5623_06960 [Escherichia coli]|nr:hypothetical protein [Escherichia coli]